jgi:DNA modification methylase
MVTQAPQRDHGEDGGWANTRGTEPARAGMEFTASQGCACSVCGAWCGAFGQETTVEMYIQHSVQILREIQRVLKDDGVCFWNVADSYSASGKDVDGSSAGAMQSKNQGSICKSGRKLSLPAKNLCLIPQKLAIAAQGDGWFIRQDIIWEKNNPMPESVRDRLTRSPEYIWMLTKQPNYFWDHEAAQEPAVSIPQRRRSSTKKNGRNDVGRVIADTGTRNMRDVWTMNVSHYQGAHFATYPLELPRRCIQLASREGDIILDPFSGAGTTGCAAKELGRHYVGLDISAEYLELAQKRITEYPGEFPISKRDHIYVPDGLSEIRWDELIQATL